MIALLIAHSLASLFVLLIVAAADAVASVPLDWTQLLIRGLMGLGGLLGTLVTALLLPAARAWLTAKAADQNASVGVKLLVGATLKLDTIVEAAVAQAWSVFERDMADAQKPDSPGGAFVTAEELQKAKDDVLASVKTYLGQQGLAELESALGFGGSLLEQYLKAQIEKKVQAAKEAGSVAAASVTTGQAAAAVISRL